METKKISDVLFCSSQNLGQNEIFHYTNTEAFYQIIKNKTLRLSSHKYLNDNKELKILEELLNEDYLNQRDIHYNIDRLNELKQIMGKINNQESFVLSFSKHQDLLSQWRGYADNSKGVSIGFNINNLRNKLMELMPRTSKASDVAKIWMQPVIYELKNQLEKLSIDKYYQPLPDRKKIISTDFWLKSISCILKPQSFKEEDEVRITYTPNIEIDKAGIKVDGPLREIKYLHSNGKLKPYFEIQFGTWNKFISSITIGANCKISEYELKRFLLINNFNPSELEIKRSSLTYVIN